MRAIINNKTLKIDEIKPNPKNPKKHNSVGIRVSIDENGYLDPIVVDENNVILSGHGRLKALRELGYDEVDVQVALGMTDEQKEKYMIKANLLTEQGGWDNELLKAFDKQFLEDCGFGDNKLSGLFEDKDKPEIEFSEDLLLEHNYVVLYFDNPMDWQVAVDKLGLKEVKSNAVTEKSQKIGIGRVLKGNEIIKRIV